MAWRIVRKISVCAIALVAIFGILDNFSLFVFDADAATSDLDASATIGASATIALNTNNVAFSILPSSEGTFGKSNALVVSTYTNNDYNCDVTMIADSANLTNGSYTIPSLEAGSTYTESTFTNNSWGYQIESGNYKPIIATEAANPIKTITTMTGSTPDTTNIYFAAKFTTAVKAGDYTNTITFASTCTPVPVYDVTVSVDSGVSSVTFVGDGTTQTATSSNTTVSLKEGVSYTITATMASDYIFSSWSTTAGVTVSSAATNPTTITATGTGTLSVVSAEDCTATTFTGYMQDIASSTIDAACNGDSGTMTDRRDSKTYTVKKIAGALWMTQNLRYIGDTGSAAGIMTIGNNNSNVANKSINLYSLNSSNAGSFNAYTNQCSYNYNYACVYNSGSTSTGVWYNYYAASGGTISTDSDETEASNDICPKNWHLPSYNSSSPVGSINSISGQTAAFSPVIGGLYVEGSLTNAGYGFWWTTTARSTLTRYRLSYNGSYLSASSSTYYNRNLGLFIRCTRQ
ncbi:hypothetical protein IKF12_02180 [Candidatus Saccharibacteria bacterium]|nr:hypothetical protein [Candidatus Saccharibacteria bacterium]